MLALMAGVGPERIPRYLPFNPYGRELVRRGLARSRDQARELVDAGRVVVSGAVASKPATQVDTAAPIVVEGDESPSYVSRGGHKLAGVSATPPGDRIAWSKGKTAGYVALTLNGAAGGNAATSIGWQFQDVNGSSLRSGSVAC